MWYDELNVAMTSRRQFLTTAFQASALAATSTLQAQAPAVSKRQLRKAIMGGTLGIKGTLIEKYQAAKAAGYEGVEPAGGMNQQEVIDALGKSGLQAASVCDHIHWVKPLSAPDAATRQLGLDGLLHSLHDAHAYGATSVLLVPGIARDGVTYQQCFDRSIVEIRKAIPVARDLGVKIAIENVGNDFIQTPEQAVEYLDAINSEWVGWHFDIGNEGRRGPAAEKWIPLLGQRIVRLHIKDYSATPPAAVAGKAPPRPKLLDGDTQWPAVMAIIAEKIFPVERLSVCRKPLFYPVEAGVPVIMPVVSNFR